MALSDGTVTSVYPWHRPLWTDVVQQSTWHHGLLVTGVSGIGKREFCLLLGRYLLCSESGGREADHRAVNVKIADCSMRVLIPTFMC